MPDIPIQDYIRQAASKAGVPVELALAVAQQESGFNPMAVNPKSGATGVFQFIPSTAKARGLNPADPVQNIQHGVTYLRELLDRHQGNVDAVLKEYGGVVNDATYVPNVVARMKAFAPIAPAATAPPPKPMAPPPASYAGMPVSETARPKLSPGKAIAESTTGMMGLVGLDPTTPSGRRNLGGAAGAIIGGLTGGTGLLAALPVIAGAAVGGGVAEGGNQILEGGPPKPMSIAKAAGEQAAYEVGGQVVAWPLKAIGRRVVAGKVGQQAKDALSASREYLMGQLDTGLKAAQSTAESLKQRLGMTAPAVSRPQAGTMAVKAIEGPAKTAKDAVGRMVDEAAASGPGVPAEPLRKRLTELSDQVTPQIQAGDSAADKALLDSYKPGTAMSSQDVSAYQQALKRVQSSDMAMLPPEHPLPRVLDYARSVIGDAETVPFSELHKIKRMLDDAVNWNQPAKKQAEQIAKGFRQTVREALKVHEPYNAATANYAAVSRLHDKSIAPRLLRAAESNPESITKLIKSDEPTKLQLLRDLLIDQTRAGGDLPQGRAAWNAVRSSWTHENLVRGGIEKLGDRIGKMDPDFQHIMYGDADGRTILQNLESLSMAWKQSGERITSIGKFVTEAKKPTVLEKALSKSSLNKAPTVQEEGADALMAAFGPVGIWKARALFRTLKGPKLNELVMWASFSPKRTQMLVSALTNPSPGMMATDLLRLFDVAGLGEGLMPGEKAEPEPGAPPVPSRAVGAGPSATSGPPPRPRTVQDVNGKQIPLQ